jgi:glycosyltransferase involved in cell wall biosynthesis
MRTTVIICTKDRPDDLRAALRSLAAQTLRPDEVLVVDAGSEPALDDPLIEELRAAFPLRHLRAAPGLTKQRNLGIRESEGDILFFFDDDVVVEPDYLRAVMAAFAGDAEGKIGAVGGRITNAVPAGPLGRGEPLRRFVRRFFLLSDLGDGRLKASGFPAQPHGLAEGRFIECLSGCGMAFRRAVFERAQFDEVLAGYSYMEDVDISQQVLALGYAIYYQPAARLAHNASPRARDAGVEIARMLVRNYAYLFRKHWNTGFSRRLAFRWALCGLLVDAVISRDPNRVQGIRAGLRDLRRSERPRPAGLHLAYVTEHLPFGPGETFIVPEIDALLKAGHEVLILPLMYRGEPAHPDAARLRGRAHRLPLKSPCFALGVLAAILHQPARCLRILRRYRGGNLKAALKGLYAAGTIRGWGAQHIHAHWADFTATMAQVIHELTGIPWSFTAHRYDIVANNQLGEKLRSAAFARFISRDGLRLARQAVEDELVKATVIHLGVAVPAEAPGPGDAPVILCPASLLPVKGHRYLIDAMALLRDRGVLAELLLAGEGELREAITAQIAALGLEDRVTFLGAVPHDRLLAMYAECGVMITVLGSVDLGGGLHEGIPAALMEAMSHGVPVVGTATGGIPELLNGDAGLLVPPADAPALADALERLLADPDLRRRLGARGRARIEEEFDVTHTAGQLAEAIRRNIPKA